MIIAVDFDGTLFAHSGDFPEVGEPIHKTIAWVKRQKDEGGHQLILWTCRENDDLQMAIDAAKDYGIEFDAINSNIYNVGGFDSRKIFANVYLDDRALNVKDI